MPSRRSTPSLAARPAARSLSRSSFSWISALGIAFPLALFGCGQMPHALPEVGDSHDEIFRAAIQAVARQYPMSTPVRKSDLILAQTPVAMNAAYPSKKQITVRLQQTYTGHWVPRVRVVQHIDTGEPHLDANPDSDFYGDAHPVADHDWTGIVYLHAEAQALHDAILAALPSSSAGARS
jgi:hypothetical protein